jgi:hypothetical protein
MQLFRRTAPTPIPAMALIDALDEPTLFGTEFADASWTPWRVALAALEGRQLDDEGLRLYRSCTGRQNPPNAPVREFVAVVGRRGGKSRVAAALAVEAACLRDWQPFLAPGEVATVAVIAADRAQARTTFGYIRGLLESSPMLAQRITGQTAHTLTLAGRVRIEVTTASARTTRGYTFAAVICDELAFWRSELTSEPDVEVLGAVRPGMTTLPGSRLICISSPYARRGALWDAFKDHYGRENDPVLVWKAPSAVMNPAIDPAAVTAAYVRDPSSAAAEYGAEFRTDVEQFLSRELLDAVVVPGRTALPPVSGTSYVAFVDPSGGAQDAMSLAIAHNESQGGHVHVVLDVVASRTPPFSPESVVKEFTKLLKAYGVGAVTGDRYAGEWPREAFGKRGISYVVSEQPKSALYVEFLPLLTSQRVALLDNKQLLQEALGLERRTARSGKDSIDHSPHQHDDLINSAAGACVLAAGAGEVRVACTQDVQEWPLRRALRLGAHDGGESNPYDTWTVQPGEPWFPLPR